MAVNSDEVAVAVREIRKAAGLTQQALAELADVGKTLIFDIEKGHPEVSFSKLNQVLEALNIQLELKLPTNIEKPVLKKSKASKKGRTRAQG